MAQDKGKVGIRRAIVITAIVLIVGGLGIIFYDRLNDASNASSNSTKQQESSNSTVSNSDTTPEIQGDPNTQRAQIVQGAYEEYVTEISGIKPSRQNGLESIREDLTPELYSAIKARYQAGSGQDEIVCDQDVPSKVEAGSSKTDASKVTVTATFGKVPKSIMVTLTADNKISAISCPQT